MQFGLRIKKFFNFFLFLIAFQIWMNEYAFGQAFSNANMDANFHVVADHNGFMGGGMAFFDYDMDGNLDIYACGGRTRDYLFRNNGNGTFTERGFEAGLGATANAYTHAVATGDIDNDGFRDVFVTTFVMTNASVYYHNFLYHNNGNGTFTNITNSSGIVVDSSWSTSATFFDYNQDGFLDIYVGNYVKETDFLRDSITNLITGFSHTGFPNYFYINNGDLTFTESSEFYGLDDMGCTLALAPTDYDNDQDVDLMVANDFGQWVIPDRLFQNEFPSNSFADVSSASGADVGLYGMGIAVGDYNEDGFLDYYITNLGENALLKSMGDGTFVEFAAAANVLNGTYNGLLTTSWGAAFFDYDHDTYLDLYVGNGYIPAAEFIETTQEDPNKLYRNNGDGTFSDVGAQEGVDDIRVGRGLAIGDYDNDGDMDILVGNLNVAITNIMESQLFRNENNGQGNWIKVYVEGTTCNRDGFGAHVLLYKGGRQFLREIDGGSSHGSQHETVAHFGLAHITSIDSIVVYWPGGGKDLVCNPEVNQNLKIIQGQWDCTLITSLEPLERDDIQFSVSPNPFGDAFQINFALNSIQQVKLEIIDLLGRQIAILEQGKQMAGKVEFRVDARKYGIHSAGAYVLKLQVGNRVLTEKLIKLP